MRWIIGAVAVLLSCVSGIGGPITPPSGIQATTFTTGLNFPDSLFQLGDGSLLVGTSNPSNTPGFTNFYTGAGQLLRFTQSNGAATGPGTTVIATLPGAITSVRPLGSLVAVATTGNQTYNALGDGDITLFRPGANPQAAYANLGGLHFHFASFDAAINLTMATVATPGMPGSYDLYFALGAGNNDGTPNAGVTVTGLVNKTLAAGSLYKVTIDTTGSVPAVGTPVQLANGIRNSGGIVVAANGNVYFNDNGFDQINGTISADELNVLTAAQISTNTVFSYGYPGNFTDASNGAFVGGQGVPPLVAFLPVGGSASNGAAEMALAPSGFPAGLNNGIFVGFHGSFMVAGVGNVENPVLYYSFDTNSYTRFIAGGQPGFGHLDGLWSTADSLYISDFASANGFPGGAGAVYKLTVDPSNVPEPSAAAMVLFGIAAAALYSAKYTPIGKSDKNSLEV